jgi:hypothetical protein
VIGPSGPAWWSPGWRRWPCPLVLWVVQAQTVTWNLIGTIDPERLNGPLALLRLASAFTGDGLPQQLATPLPLLVLLAAVAATAII